MILAIERNDSMLCFLVNVLGVEKASHFIAELCSYLPFGTDEGDTLTVPDSQVTETGNLPIPIVFYLQKEEQFYVS